MTHVVTRATQYAGVWTTWSMYEEDECVSSQFGRKDTTQDIELYIQSSNGCMRMRAVGANSANPGSSYADCSGGLSRTVIIGAGSGTYYYLPNYVMQYGYDYAGILATSVEDDLIEARGLFDPR